MGWELVVELLQEGREIFACEVEAGDEFFEGGEFLGMQDEVGEQLERSGAALGGIEAGGEGSDGQHVLEFIADDPDGEEGNRAGDGDLRDGGGFHFDHLALRGVGVFLPARGSADDFVRGAEAGEIETGEDAQKGQDFLRGKIIGEGHLPHMHLGNKRTAVTRDDKSLGAKVLKNRGGVFGGEFLAHADNRDENGASAKIGERAAQAGHRELFLLGAILE